MENQENQENQVSDNKVITDTVQQIATDVQQVTTDTVQQVVADAKREAAIAAGKEEVTTDTVQQLVNDAEKEVTTQIDNLIDSLEIIESKVAEQQNTVGSPLADTMIDINLDSAEKIQDLDLVINILKNKDIFKATINKLNCNLNDADLVKINILVTFLITENKKKYLPLKNVFEEIQKILLDGKLNLQDIPTILNVMTNVLNFNLNNKKIKIDVETVGIFMKLLLHILITEKIIKIDDTEENIYKLIDSSLLLLGVTIKITKAKCKCLPF
jgi:hypothetical protein